MRKVFVMLLAVTLIFPVPGQAAVTFIADVPAVFITSQHDAIDDLVIEQKGIEPTEPWVFAEDDNTLPQEHVVVANEVRRLAKTLGVGFFYDLPITVLPCKTFTTPEDKETYRGMSYFSRDHYKAKIILCGLQSNPSRSLRHEVGHLVARRVLNVPGNCWDAVNDVGQEYLQVRQYPYSVDNQTKLPWKNRAAEWFAEDFAWWITPEWDRNNFDWVVSADHPVTVDGLEEYFDLLFLDLESGRGRSDAKRRTW